MRDGLDFGLRAPVLRNIRNGTANDGVIVGGTDERRHIRDTIGREHGILHHLAPQLGGPIGANHPISGLLQYRPRRPAFGLADGGAQRRREALLLPWAEEARERKSAAARDQK